MRGHANSFKRLVLCTSHAGAKRSVNARHPAAFGIIWNVFGQRLALEHASRSFLESFWNLSRIFLALESTEHDSFHRLLGRWIGTAQKRSNRDDAVPFKERFACTLQAWAMRWVKARRPGVSGMRLDSFWKAFSSRKSFSELSGIFLESF